MNFEISNAAEWAKFRIYVVKRNFLFKNCNIVLTINKAS